MDIFEIIESEHEQVKEHVEKMLDMSPGATKQRSDGLRKLKAMLLPHMEAEERIFYPWLLEETEERQMVFEALEEHKAAQMVLRDVEESGDEPEHWMANVKVLKDLLEHHIEEEESEIFDEARKFADDDDADEMGERFEALEKEVASSM